MIIQISTFLGEPWGYLELAGLLCLLALGSGWLGYLYGCHQAPLWRAALADLPVGLALFDRRRRAFFKNEVAGPLLKQLDAATLERVHQAGAQDLEYRAAMRGREGALIQAQAWALGGKKRGVALALRDTTQEYEQQQQLESHYRRRIDTLSHELNAPVATIRLQLRHMANSDGGDGASQRQALQVAQSETERLIRLVANLLALSRLELSQTPQRRLTKLNGLVEEAMAQLIEPANARQVSLELEADPNLPRVPLDDEAWRQVFLNLIDNGIKYGKPGGTVRVELRQQMAGLQITVADDGPGIPPDELPHLFKELFRGQQSRHTGGSGLGLAIVRRIVEQHGGQISCASEPGRGTAFHITLPVEG